VRVRAAHAVLATILVGSLAARERADALPDDVSFLESSVLRVAASHGWSLNEYRATSGTPSRALVFAAPDCTQPVQVSLRLSSTFEEQTLLEYVREPGYVRRYVYFDRIWDTPDHRAAALQRMKYAALAMFGLTEYAPSWYLLLIEAPSNCRAAQAIDWRSVWNRDDLAVTRAEADVTVKKQ
jgi:hypothetical protein